MRSDGQNYSTHNHLMFISQEREVQVMYDLEQQPDLEVDKLSIASSSYVGSILVPASPAQREGDRRSALKSLPAAFRLEPNRRQPDADELTQPTAEIPSPSTDYLSTYDPSNRRLSRLSRFYNTFKSPIGINFVIADFMLHVADGRYSRCSTGPGRTFAAMTRFPGWGIRSFTRSLRSPRRHTFGF